MITEVVLDPENEDPVNIIRIREEKSETKTDDFGDEYEVKTYSVEHILEARGTPHTKAKWLIKC